MVCKSLRWGLRMTIVLLQWMIITIVLSLFTHRITTMQQNANIRGPLEIVFVTPKNIFTQKPTIRLLIFPTYTNKSGEDLHFAKNRKFA